jgi:hypothetical protein
MVIFNSYVKLPEGIWCESVQGYSGYMAVFASDFAMADLGDTCLSRIVSTALVVHLAMPGGLNA